MLDEQGPAATEDWIKGMVNNLAEPVFSSDTPMIRAVAQGQCGVALANSYYLGRMQAGDKGEADRTLSGKVTVRWPDPVHVNITGGGVTRASRNPEAAQRLLEFLARIRPRVATPRQTTNIHSRESGRTRCFRLGALQPGQGVR